jgi:hypothetical protein
MAAAKAGPIDPAPAVAAALDEAAERARARGGLIASAAAYERAAELTSGPAERARRLTAAANDLWCVGRAERAAPLLAEARELAADAQLRIAIVWGSRTWPTLLTGGDRRSPAVGA